MKKGFTLIELLAVIVILAIIALIAIPTITKVVEQAKKGGAEQSALGYNDAVSKQIAINLMDSNDLNNIEEGIYNAPFDTKYNVSVKGTKPTKGWIEVTKNGVDRYSLVVGEYVVSYDGETKTVIKGTEPNEKPNIFVYRYSINSLSDGDQIDLANHKIIVHVHYDYDSNSYKNDLNEIYDMTGIYSTNINDVLKVSMKDQYAVGACYGCVEGELSSEKNIDNTVFLKHTIDSEGYIKKTELCLNNSWGIFCQHENYNYGRTSNVDPNYLIYKKNLYNYFKWDDENKISEYDGISCRSDDEKLTGSSWAYCQTPTTAFQIYGNSTGISTDKNSWVKCYTGNSSECYQH